MEYTELKRLIDLKNKSEINRLGHPFFEDEFYYFYDTGTGKVLEMDKISWDVINLLFDVDKEIRDIQDILNYTSCDLTCLQELDEVIKTENLFKALKPVELCTVVQKKLIDDKLKNGINQIILEVTGKCNMRCRYCIYNDHYIYQRSFNKKDMTKDIAKKAIDYINEHGSENVSITFYGGEPLINFDLIKWSIEYALSIIKNKKITFSLTTNLTLITDEIADYLSSIPNLFLVVSLDGPKEIHDSYRILADKRESFSKAIDGLKVLCKWYNKRNKKELVINSVFTPPYSYNKVLEIQDYFNSLDFLPENTTYQITYPSEGSLPDDENLLVESVINDNEQDMSIWKFLEKIALNKDVTEEIFNKYSSMFMPLVRVHNRYLCNDVTGTYPFNACCIPCSRRMYINTDGEILLCEKIGDSPSVGNIKNNIDVTKLKKCYVDDYNNIMINKCANCWAIRSCSNCYIDKYDKTGIRKNINDANCIYSRAVLEQSLLLYHKILKFNPKFLQWISEVEIW